EYIEDIIKVIDIIDQGQTTRILNPMQGRELEHFMREAENLWFKKTQLENELNQSGVNDGDINFEFTKKQIELEELYKTAEENKITIGIQKALINDLNYTKTRLYLLKLLSNEPYNVINTDAD